MSDSSGYWDVESYISRAKVVFTKSEYVGRCKQITLTVVFTLFIPHCLYICHNRTKSHIAMCLLIISRTIFTLDHPVVSFPCEKHSLLLVLIVPP